LQAFWLTHAPRQTGLDCDGKEGVPVRSRTAPKVQLRAQIEFEASRLVTDSAASAASLRAGEREYYRLMPGALERVASLLATPVATVAA
jgi:hypothetical protein